MLNQVEMTWLNYFVIFWISRWVKYEKGKNILSETSRLGISTTCAGSNSDIYLKDLNMAYVVEGQCLFIFFFPILQNNSFTIIT